MSMATIMLQLASKRAKDLDIVYLSYLRVWDPFFMKQQRNHVSCRPLKAKIYMSFPVFHYHDVIIGVIASQITSLRLFTQPLIQTQIKENMKAPRHWPLCGEFTWGQVNSLHKRAVTRKMFPFDDVIMPADTRNMDKMRKILEKFILAFDFISAHVQFITSDSTH